MIFNYFKTAWRNILKNQAFAVTNLFSLTIGISAALLIMIWVKNELSWDRNHDNYDSIYQVYANRSFNGSFFTDNSIMQPLGPTLEKELPGVEFAAATSYSEDHILGLGDKKLDRSGYRVTNHFFDIFSFWFLHGNASAALSFPEAIVLSETTARSIFGSTDVVGQTLKIDNQSEVKVSAVFADAPLSTTIRPDFILPYNLPPAAMQDWVNSYSALYVKSSPQVNETALNKGINLIISRRADVANHKYFVHPMKKWRLYGEFTDGINTGGMITYVRMFSLIGVVILLIGCINFMNLSTARSEKRAREVGIRKTLGSGKKQLMFQFICESVIMASIAFAISLLIVKSVLPAFNRMIEGGLSLKLSDPYFWIFAVVTVMFTGLIAGSYPAIYLSSFNPVAVLKGSFLPGKSALLPRRVLVVFQFVISILLSSATVIIYQQIQHVKSRDLGYDSNNLIVIPPNNELSANVDVIRNELTSRGVITSLTQTSSPMTEIYNYSPAPDYQGKPEGPMIVTSMSTTKDFTRTMGIRMAAGADFSGMPSDTSALLLNETAVRTMGLKSPVGTIMRQGTRTYTVKGVIKDVVMASPYEPVDPLIVYYRPARRGFVSIRLKADRSPQEALVAIRQVFAKYNPGFPFEFSFVDADFNRKFMTEELIGKLTNLFAALAIFICGLGMAGLASFTIEKRFRELSIRKILGASIQQLLMLVAREFLKLVVIAFIVAVPLTWWAMNNWLAGYEYRVTIGYWIFLAVGVAILAITLFIIWINIMRAARANPASKLRAD